MQIHVASNVNKHGIVPNQQMYLMNVEMHKYDEIHPHSFIGEYDIHMAIVSPRVPDFRKL